MRFLRFGIAPYTTIRSDNTENTRITYGIINCRLGRVINSLIF